LAGFAIVDIAANAHLVLAPTTLVVFLQMTTQLLLQPHRPLFQITTKKPWFSPSLLLPQKLLCSKKRG